MWGVLLIGMPFYGVLPLVEANRRIWLVTAASAVPIYAAVVYSIVHISMRQAMTPEPMLGRMNTTMRFLNRCAVPLGSLAGGAMGTWLGPRSALLIAAAGASLAFLPLLLSPVRTIRRVPTIEDAASSRPAQSATR